MPLRYVVFALILAAMVPGGAMALGLGDIHLKSPLNAPLEAEIDLTASAEELRGLKVTLASRENFSRYGLDYPVFLDSVTLMPGKAADGRDVVQLRSTAVVTEPFATLLIEASWPRGRLVREYTVLLDPPVFTGDKASPAAAVAAPVEAPQAHSGSVSRMVPSAAPAPEVASPGAEPTAADAAAPASPGAYLVRQGETLSGIAAGHYPNAERERALLAIFRANPAAFSNNMNELHAGATLQLPDEAALAAIGPAEARAEVGSQYHAWSGSRGANGGRLRLVPPSEPATGAMAGAATGETAALQQRVTALQGQLAESQRMLELKNAELARLQKQLAQGKPGGAQPPTVTSPPPPAKVAQEAPKPAQQELPPPPVAKAPRHGAAQPPARAVRPETGSAAGGSLFDWLTSNWYLPLGILAALVAAVFGWRQLRTQREHRFGRTLDRLANMPAEGAAGGLVRSAETQPMKTLHARQDSSFVVEESGAHPAPRMGAAESAAMQSAPVAVDDEVSATGTAVAIDQGDPLAEADFHMAYGLYDQAADLVRIAISREPQRRDLQLKLLEVYFVWGNKDQFLQLARELSADREHASAGEWEKIVIMGRQIAPEDTLFAAGGALPGAASGGVDLNLEGGQNRVDFDLLGEPSVVAQSPGDAVDLDLSAALSSQDSTGEVRAPGDTGVDFVLDDPARGGDATGSTREMQQSPTVTLDFGDPSPDSPTVENLAAHDVESPTIRQKLEASSRNLLQGVEPTAEVAMVDLGLDLSAGATSEHNMAGADAPTMLAGLDEDTRNLYAQQGQQLESRDTAIMPAPGGASGTWLFTDKDMEGPLADAGADLGAYAPTQLVSELRPATSEGITSRLEAIKEQGGGDVDLDLGGLESTAEPGGALDLDVGQAAAGPDVAFAATQRLASPPEFNESEPATMSEVGTKLDLARAYMDMGDPEGARSILEEVLAEGSASQKAEARRLVDSLPG